MKKHILCITLILVAFLSFAQDKIQTKEKINSLKIAYLTEQLALTSSEAQKFWPVYNKHTEKLNYLRNKGRAEIRKKLNNPDDLSSLNEATAEKMVLLKLKLEQEMVSEKENFVKETAQFLPYKKILKLQLTEREFARKLMRKYGRGRKPLKN